MPCAESWNVYVLWTGPYKTVLAGQIDVSKCNETKWIFNLMSPVPVLRLETWTHQCSTVTKNSDMINLVAEGHSSSLCHPECCVEDVPPCDVFVVALELELGRCSQLLFVDFLSLTGSPSLNMPRNFWDFMTCHCWEMLGDAGRLSHS